MPSSYAEVLRRFQIEFDISNQEMMQKSMPRISKELTEWLGPAFRVSRKDLIGLPVDEKAELVDSKQISRKRLVSGILDVMIDKREDVGRIEREVDVTGIEFLKKRAITIVFRIETITRSGKEVTVSRDIKTGRFVSRDIPLRE